MYLKNTNVLKNTTQSLEVVILQFRFIFNPKATSRAYFIMNGKAYVLVKLFFKSA